MIERFGDLARAILILAASSLLGLAVNSLSARPVPLLDPDGPGSLPDRQPRAAAADLKAAWDRGEAVVLIDVRTDLRDGGSPRALRIPAAGFLEEYRRQRLDATLKAAQGIFVLCEGGECSSSDRVVLLLRSLGHEHARVLDGGWPAYRAAGLEVSTP